MIKLRFDREVLADKLKKAMGFVPKKSLIPSEEHFKLNVTGGTMSIIAADSRCQVKLFCPVKASSDVAFCMPAKLFYNTIDKLRENEIIISITEKKIEIKSGKSKYVLTPDCKAEDWPVMPVKASHSEASILQYNLKMGIKFASSFIDEERSVKVNAGGVNIHEINNRLVFTGLDGHNACRVNVAPLGIGSWQSNFVLPEDSAKKISSLLTDNGEITISHDGDKMVLFTDDSVEQFEIITTSINTRFPDSEKIFGMRVKDYMVINTSEFKDAILRLKLYASVMDSEKVVTVRTNPDNLNELILSIVDNLTNKEGEEIMTVNNNAGKAMLKHFTSASILNILNCVENNDFLLYFHESDKVVVFIQPMVSENEINCFDFLMGSVKK